MSRVLPVPGPSTRGAENPGAVALSNQSMMYRATLQLIALAILVVGPVDRTAAQIYRCEQGETTVFADVPCSESPELVDARTGISVVAVADRLDEVARANKAFVDRRRERLADRRARAALRQQAERDRQARAPAEEIRYRTVVAASPGSGVGWTSGTDPRVEAQRRQAAPEDEPARRRTLLSRSGGNQPRILRR